MKNKSSFIGTNFGHSSSCCHLNNDGEVDFAIEEERLNGQKHTSSFPSLGIEMLFKSCNIEGKIIWSEGWDIYKRLLIKGGFHYLKFQDDAFEYKKRWQNEFNRFVKGWKEFNKLGSFNFIGHHRSHAYSLLPYGLPKNSLIYVSDTIGESESISFFYWDGKLRFLSKMLYPNSPGAVFHQFAYYIGFKGRTGPGKLMALAGYGKPNWIDELNRIAFLSDVSFHINQKNYPSHRLKDAPNKFIQKITSSQFRQELRECENSYNNAADIAASIQEWFTNVTWKLLSNAISHYRKKSNLIIDHIGLVGGAALNCQTNGFISKKLPTLNIETLTICPWPDDSGTAIGAAVGSFLRAFPEKEIKIIDPFLGPPLFQTRNTYTQSDLEKAVQYVLDGNLIALCSGKMEFGPRALGGRCVIGSAFLTETKERLNSCKKRESFMPIAPAILEEDFICFFKGEGSYNMSWTVEANHDSAKYIPSAIHVTNEARVQLVSPDNLLLYDFLRVLKKKKGYGVCLLTSLNDRDEPIPVFYSDVVAVSKKLGLKAILSDKGWESF